MIHDTYQEEISQLIDGELGNDKQRALFAHLSECAECRDFFNATLTLRSNLAASSPVTLPAGFDQRMESASSGTSINTRPEAFRLAVAASIAFLLLMGSLVFGPQMLRTQISDASAYVPIPSAAPFYPQQN